MGSEADIRITLEEADHPSVIAIVEMAAGVAEVCGDIGLVGRTLHVRRAHIQGLSPNALGYRGLCRLARAVLEVLDVDRIVVEGAARTTGARPGHTPRPFRYPR